MSKQTTSRDIPRPRSCRIACEPAPLRTHCRIGRHVARAAVLLLVVVPSRLTADTVSGRPYGWTTLNEMPRVLNDGVIVLRNETANVADHSVKMQIVEYLVLNNGIVVSETRIAEPRFGFVMATSSPSERKEILSVWRSASATGTVADITDRKGRTTRVFQIKFSEDLPYNIQAVPAGTYFPRNSIELGLTRKKLDETRTEVRIRDGSVWDAKRKAWTGGASKGIAFQDIRTIRVEAHQFLAIALRSGGELAGGLDVREGTVSLDSEGRPLPRGTPFVFLQAFTGIGVSETKVDPGFVISVDDVKAITFPDAQLSIEEVTSPSKPVAQVDRCASPLDDHYGDKDKSSLCQWRARPACASYLGKGYSSDYIRAKLGSKTPEGDPYTWQPDGSTPIAGSVALFDYGRFPYYADVAWVDAVDADRRTFIISMWNHPGDYIHMSSNQPEGPWVDVLCNIRKDFAISKTKLVDFNPAGTSAPDGLRGFYYPWKHADPAPRGTGWKADGWVKVIFRLLLPFLSPA